MGRELREREEGPWGPFGGSVVHGEGTCNPESYQVLSVSAIRNYGERHASREWMEDGVEKKALVVHLSTLCQTLYMP